MSSPKQNHVPLLEIRMDLARAVVLCILVALIWCAIYDRWTVESWQTPLSYTADPNKQDGLLMLAWIKAGSAGDLLPFHYSNVMELGAPLVGNWNDFPVTEKPLFCLTGLLADIIGLFPAANFAVLLEQILAALSFYTACQLWRSSWIWSFAGALVFSFSTFMFAQGLHHLIVTYCWHVPLALVVCEWVIRGRGIEFGERRFVFTLIIAFLTGIQHVYYTNLFVQLILFGCLVQVWRHGWRAACPGVSVAGTALASGFLMNANTIVYQLVYGRNSDAVIRPYQWVEAYGLKWTDLVIPPPDHRFSPFAAWGAHHLKEVILPVGELSSGYLGLVGLAALTWLVFVSFQRVVNHSRLPIETWIILWILIYGGVGGLNGIFGTLGVLLFRATTRYSIFILCLVLMFAVRRLSVMKWSGTPWSYGAALLCILVALWDQTPPMVTENNRKEIEQEVASDCHFTEQMEQRLAPNGMVFQTPVMVFPEGGSSLIGAYDHFRPYLYSHQLRFSFGSNKGRSQDKWQSSLSPLSLNDVLNQLESYGFSALYVNRNGYADKGESLVKAFQKAGRADIIQSDQGDLICLFLKPSPQPILPGDE